MIPQSHSMPRVKRKTKAEDLRRIRDNQRRCRQRRRDYVAELESRIASYEQTTTQAIRTFRAAEEKHLKENQDLRVLLNSCGLDSTVLEQQNFIQEHQNGTSDERGSSTAELCAVPSTLLLSDNRNLDFVGLPTMTPQIVDPETLPPLDVILPLSPSRGFAAPSFIPTFDDDYVPDFSSSLSHPLRFYSLIDSNISGIATSGVIDAVLYDTTLCTVAIRLISLCNKKDLDMLELDSKLRRGYRNPKSLLEGCRVDNCVLLSVLAEIMQ